MSKHTPGPWTAEICDDGWGAHSVISGAIAYDDKPYICGLSDRTTAFAPDDDEAIANAHLIAAAPCLLEALRALDEAYCRAGSPLTKAERDEDRRRLVAARAAIAKAEGKQ